MSGSTPALSTLPGSYHLVNTVSGYSLTGSPTWTNLATTATSQISLQQVILTQQGNIALPTVSITGTPLVGNAGPTSLIVETAFKMGVGASICTTGATLSTLSQSITGAVIPQTYAGLGVDTLTLETCVAHGGPLSTYQSGPSSTTYTNTLNPWTLNAV